MTSWVPDELREFCETTTVRGVPRMLKAKNRVVFIVWLVAVISCTCLLIWQLSVIFVRYANFPVSTLLVQSALSANPPFPDITICNANPFVHDKLLSPRFIDFSRKIVSQSFDKNHSIRGGVAVTASDFEAFRSFLLTPPGYYSNFPVFSSIFNEANYSMIVDCSYADWNYVTYNSACMQKPIVNWDPDYYKCYTLRLNETEQTNIRAFSAVLYIEDYTDEKITKFNGGITSRSVKGARILVHPSGTIPDMKRGLSISPGVETTIGIATTIRSRLAAPYSNCTIGVFAVADGSNMTYTSDLCTDLCSQDKITEMCGCLWSGARGTFEQSTKMNFTICGNVSKYSNSINMNTEAFGKFKCVQALTTERQKCYYGMCPFPCRDIYYDTSVSSVLWPHPSTELSFYQTYILGKPRFGDMFESYRKPLDLLLLKVNSSADFSLNLTDQQTIQSRFLQLKIVFNDYTFNEITDVPAYPVDTMGSNIGGTLSLWLGVTVMLVVELFEFLYTLIVTRLESKQNKFGTKADSQ